MGKWIKYINPQIEPDDWDLLKRWAKASGNGVGRWKIIIRNGDLIVKTKPGDADETFNEMWIPLSLPENVLSLSTSKFHDEILIEDQRQSGMGTALDFYMFSEAVTDLTGEERLDWFNNKFGEFGVNKIDVNREYKVCSLGETIGQPFNVVNTVFWFYFNTTEDAVAFKLTWC